MAWKFINTGSAADLEIRRNKIKVKVQFNLFDNLLNEPGKPPTKARFMYIYYRFHYFQEQSRKLLKLCLLEILFEWYNAVFRQQEQDINDCFHYRKIEFLMMNSDSVSKPTSGLLYNVHVTVNPACPIW